MPQFSQRFGFDLSDPLAGHIKLFAHFFKGVVGIHIDTKPHPQDFGFPGCQIVEDVTGGFGETFRGGGIHRGHDVGVLDKVAQVGVFVVANGCLHGDRFFGDFQYLADFVLGHFHSFAEFFRRGFAAHFLQHLPGDTIEFVDGFNHMHRNTDGARLVGDGSGDGLTDPPGGIGREFVAAAVFKLVHRLHQADVAFLNQVEELQAAVGVFLGNRNYQTQVGFHHFFFGATSLGLAD